VRIVNATAVEIHYEIKGGPLRMTMSTCDLLPGEEEVWRQPYRGLMPECEVLIEVSGETLRATVSADATVRVTPAGIQLG
jgi:hypothetical protein